jgi:hypothetical protein|uniref:Uncharacterized protein n=1 Tax=CrAss-like virus sp. ctt4r3 TaxID=2823619 RepID=A0A8S5L7H2_9CAUD|nr:MAG TPA: hypothetical protein [CrAss-like virus sp. ctt4r3]
MDTTTETKVKVSAISRLIEAGSKQITIYDYNRLTNVSPKINIQQATAEIESATNKLKNLSATEIIIAFAELSIIRKQEIAELNNARLRVNEIAIKLEQHNDYKEQLYKRLNHQESLIKKYQSDITIYKDVVKHLKIAFVIAIIVIIIVCTLGIII